jgi:hypothetical protein
MEVLPVKLVPRLSDDYIANTKLGYNTLLKSLNLYFCRLRPRQLASCTNTLLSQVASPSIERINVDVYIEEMDESEATDWETFAQSFSRPLFAQLRTIELNVRNEEMGVKHRIEAKLAECGARDIILTRSFYC